MRTCTRVAVGALTAIALSLGVTTGAQAASPDSESQATADSVAETVAEIAAPAPADAGAQIVVAEGALDSGGEQKVQGESLEISLPASDDGAVSLARPGDDGAQLSVGLPSGDGPAEAAVAADGTVAYDSKLEHTAVAVQAFDHGVRIQTVLSDASAPSTFEYPVDVPAGGSIVTQDDGGITVLDADGLPQGGFAAPWARDANGSSVPTHYQVNGTTVVQVVEHTGAAYPVVADPWLWIDLIAGATWEWHSEGWTLKVSPTGWARANAGAYLVGVAGWDELYSKYRNRGLNTNLSGMRDQFICHQQIVAIRAPGKATWNLDEWRPSVGYLQTVNASCNPGGPRFFD